MKDKYLVPIVISTTKAKALKMSDIRRERERELAKATAAAGTLIRAE